MLFRPFAMTAGSRVGGTGLGIFPRGPSTTPSQRPTSPMCGTSDRKKSKEFAIFLAFPLLPPSSSICSGEITWIPAAFAFCAASWLANIATFNSFPLPPGRRTSSLIRLLGFFKSTSLIVNDISTDSTNLRSGALARASWIAVLISFSILITPAVSEVLPSPAIREF